MPAANPLAGLEATREYQHTRRSLVRKFVGRKPTVRERMALDNAARCMVIADLASRDFSTTADMQAKRNSAARNALEALKLVASERPRRSSMRWLDQPLASFAERA
jgi:hypothetical protein